MIVEGKTGMIISDHVTMIEEIDGIEALIDHVVDEMIVEIETEIRGITGERRDLTERIDLTDSAIGHVTIRTIITLTDTLEGGHVIIQSHVIPMSIGLKIGLFRRRDDLQKRVVRSRIRAPRRNPHEMI